jgi:transmembrane sensor
MIANEEQVRAAIAEQAGEWFVANDEGPLDRRDCAALAAWLKASPVHVEEFLGVAVIARDLREAGTVPELSLEAITECVRAEDDTRVQSLWPRVIASVRGISSNRWLTAAATMAAVVVLGVGLFSLWKVRPSPPVSAPEGMTALHFETRHGEQLTRRLTDNSVLHLDTDTAVTVRYGKTERVVVLGSGQADFEVAHDSQRAFRVLAGSAEVIAVGTQFDVRLERASTVVTVIEGRVAVGPSPMLDKSGMPSSQNHSRRSVQLGADQQIRVAEGQWPVAPETVDAQRTTAWLHRQIVFDQEPLERVAAEFNRYATKPVEIATPELGNLHISGVFATDDTDDFIAFLRSLKGVKVDVTATQIRVYREPRRGRD